MTDYKRLAELSEMIDLELIAEYLRTFPERKETAYDTLVKPGGRGQMIVDILKYEAKQRIDKLQEKEFPYDENFPTEIDLQ